MLFPTDPDKKPLLWESIVEQLTINPIQVLLKDGVYKEGEKGRILINDEVMSFIKILKDSDFKRFGASGNTAIGPFWAFDQDGSKLIAKTLLIPVNDEEKVTQKKVINEIEAMAINIFFEKKDIKEIFIPLRNEILDFQDWASECTKEGVLLTKK